MPADKTIDTVLLIISGGLLIMGLGSALLGWALRVWDRVMSRSVSSVPSRAPIAVEHRSDAVERDGNGAEQGHGTPFRSAITFLEQCNDDELLDILARLVGPDGDYRFAESRVAKFIPGRVEDRLAQVRAVRDTTPPPPPPRQLRVKDEHGERVIAMK